MTDKTMQISFLPQDIELIKSFVYGKGYLNRVTYNSKLDGLYINMSKVKDNYELCSDITDLIISLIKKRDLKDYIWKTYTNINDNEKSSVYSEALNLFDKKQDFIKETVFNKISDLITENKDLNLEGFFKFRMKDFVSYISILSDIALEEHLIKRDKKEFLDSLKYFINIQEEKMNLLRIIITKEGHFILSDENGWVKGIKCVKMELGEADDSGRRRPVPVEGSEFVMDVDTVIMSLGTSPNPLISSTTEGLEVNRWKCIVAEEETGKTSKEGVYAGGDAVTGAATVILAMGAGKAAAKGIHEFLSNK